VTPTDDPPGDGRTRDRTERREADDLNRPVESTATTERGGAGVRRGTDGNAANARPGRELLLVLALGLVPWTVVVYTGGVDLLFPWGLVNTDPWQLTDLPSYLTVYTAGFQSLPARLQAWPVATGVHALAVGSALLTAADRCHLDGVEDRRLTAGLLVLAALVHLQVTLGLDRVGERSLPVGALLAFGVAWIVYPRSA